MGSGTILISSLRAVLSMCPTCSAHDGDGSCLAVHIMHAAASRDVRSDVIVTVAVTVTVLKAALHHHPAGVVPDAGEAMRAAGSV